MLLLCQLVVVYCSAGKYEGMIDIVTVESSRDFNCVKELFKEYEKALGFGLDFQNFEKELDDLPRVYAPPEGCLILVLFNKQIAGCVALRRLEDKICEMKRLYVRPQFRGKGIGRA